MRLLALQSISAILAFCVLNCDTVIQTSAKFATRANRFENLDSESSSQDEASVDAAAEDELSNAGEEQTGTQSQSDDAQQLSVSEVIDRMQSTTQGRLQLSALLSSHGISIHDLNNQTLSALTGDSDEEMNFSESAMMDWSASMRDAIEIQQHYEDTLALHAWHREQEESGQTSGNSTTTTQDEHDQATTNSADEFEMDEVRTPISSRSHASGTRAHSHRATPPPNRHPHLTGIYPNHAGQCPDGRAPQIDRARIQQALEQLVKSDKQQDGITDQQIIQKMKEQHVSPSQIASFQALERRSSSATNLGANQQVARAASSLSADEEAEIESADTSAIALSSASLAVVAEAALIIIITTIGLLVMIIVILAILLIFMSAAAAYKTRKASRQEQELAFHRTNVAVQQAIRDHQMTQNYGGIGSPQSVSSVGVIGLGGVGGVGGVGQGAGYSHPLDEMNAGGVQHPIAMSALDADEAESADADLNQDFEAGATAHPHSNRLGHKRGHGHAHTMSAAEADDEASQNTAVASPPQQPRFVCSVGAIASFSNTFLKSAMIAAKACRLSKKCGANNRKEGLSQYHFIRIVFGLEPMPSLVGAEKSRTLNHVVKRAITNMQVLVNALPRDQAIRSATFKTLNQGMNTMMRETGGKLKIDKGAAVKGLWNHVTRSNK